jgi:carboxyl-terminal processing protease
VAGALQDQHRALILGTRSFGKGSVQTIMQVTGGGAIRLTTALYFTPSGRSIQKEGIKPDIEVEPSKVEAIQQRPGFREENLRRSINNPGLPTDKKEKKDDKPAAGTTTPPGPAAGTPQQIAPAPAVPPASAPQQSGDPDEPPAQATSDYQLTRAMDLIRGISLYSQRAN